jgi:hypothetical protein
LRVDHPEAAARHRVDPTLRRPSFEPKPQRGEDVHVATAQIS